MLGFGAMRLPPKDKDAPIFSPLIDEPEAINMIQYAIDEGVNYIDTAYTYHGGKSEVLLSKALQDGYRDKVKIATKIPPPLVRNKKDFDRILNKQLDRLKAEYIDFYLFHGLQKEWWKRVLDLDMFQWAEDAIDDGRVKYLGFSFHDNFELFKEIVDAYDNWALSQIQYNFMDVENQAGTKGLEYAASKGLALVVMEPLRGGQLTMKPPEFVEKLYDDAQIKRTPAEWALHWLWDHPEVTVVLSGMSTISQVKENVSSAKTSGPNMLTKEELLIVEKVRMQYEKLSPILCTNCRYCMPCPNGVEIPRIFRLYNEGFMYEDHRRSRFFYREIPKSNQAVECTQCHECEEKCPQKLPVSEWLEKAHGWLGPKKK